METYVTEAKGLLLIALVLLNGLGETHSHSESTLHRDSRPWAFSDL